MEGKAIVLSGGVFQSNAAKTTHGLIRGSYRFDVVGVVDRNHHGNDAGFLLDGKRRNIPVYESIESAILTGTEFEYCIIGVAPKGGRLPDDMRADILEAIKSRKNIISGLHHFLAEDKEFANTAAISGAKIIDIRKPRPRSELAFWTGKIYDIKCPKIAVLGTDCGLGKRTTAKLMVEMLRRNNLKSEMIYTGQTGWLQGWKYGFILDSTYNDFVSGELEHWMYECWIKEHPDCIIIEGQSALRNPSGPCGAEFLISGNLDGVVMQHGPARPYYHGFEKQKLEIPRLEDEIELIQHYKVPIIAIALNTKGLSMEEAKQYQEEYQNTFGLPVVLPVKEGVDKLLPVFQKMINLQVR